MAKQTSMIAFIDHISEQTHIFLTRILAGGFQMTSVGWVFLVCLGVFFKAMLSQSQICSLPKYLS